MKPSENHHLSLLGPFALWSFTASFITLIRFSDPLVFWFLVTTLRLLVLSTRHRTTISFILSHLNHSPYRSEVVFLSWGKYLTEFSSTMFANQSLTSSDVWNWACFFPTAAKKWCSKVASWETKQQSETITKLECASCCLTYFLLFQSFKGSKLQTEFVLSLKGQDKSHGNAQPIYQLI